MQLRPATRADLVAIEALEREAFANETYPAFFFRQAHDLWPEWLLVAQVDRDLRGYALAAPSTDADVAWLLSMAVGNAARGRGIGKALVRATIAAVEAKGFATMRLTAHPGNVAVKLYEQLGFRVVSSDPDYFQDGEPRVVLELLIRA